MGFDTDIRPLFRAVDVRAMEAWFDLGSYDEVREHADSILERVEDGDMPCDTPWEQDKVDTLRAWIEQGCPP